MGAGLMGAGLTGGGLTREGGSASAGRAAGAALQAALGAEQAAIYGYGVVGAHLADSAQARADWTAHQVAADQLTAQLRGRGITPGPAAVAYALPHRVNTPGQARALAITLEDQVASAYVVLVGLPEGSLRLLGARQVRAAALRAAAWRNATVAFPGLPASALSRPASTSPPPTASRASAARAGPADPAFALTRSDPSGPATPGQPAPHHPGHAGRPPIPITANPTILTGPVLQASRTPA